MKEEIYSGESRRANGWTRRRGKEDIDEDEENCLY